MIIKIQPGGQTGLSSPPPAPYSILDNGDVDDQQRWRGDPAALLGFQDQLTEKRVDLFREDWWRDPQSAVGKYPVFVTSTGSIWVLKLAIVEVVEVVEIEQPHPHVAAWTLTADTQRGDHNAAIGTSVVTDHATGNDVATVYVYVSAIDGALVVDIDACTDVRVRMDINDDTVHNSTIPA